MTRATQTTLRAEAPTCASLNSCAGDRQEGQSIDKLGGGLWNRIIVRRVHLQRFSHECLTQLFIFPIFDRVGACNHNA